jgi:hypothetical protein
LKKEEIIWINKKLILEIYFIFLKTESILFILRKDEKKEKQKLFDNKLYDLPTPYLSRAKTEEKITQSFPPLDNERW